MFNNSYGQKKGENVNSFFEGVEIYPKIGENHNKFAKEFLNNNHEKLINLSLNERSNLIIDFFNDSYDKNVSGIINEFRDYKNFDPKSYVKDHNDRMSQYMFSKVIDLLNKTKNVRADKNKVLNLIRDFKSDVQNDNNYLTNEKEAFLNMLIVFEKSVELWYDNEFVDQFKELNKTTSKIDDDDYWKIAASDYVGGIAGGLTGGPAGAAIGIAAGSLQSVISLW